MATKVRNPVARTPILGKGGAHVKSRSGERHKLKQQTRREARQWSREKGADRPPSRFLGLLHVASCRKVELLLR